MLQRPSTVVFDLDRTITRSGTWTPFLWHCKPLTTIARLWRFVQGLPTVLGYFVGRVPRNALKERMVQLWIAGTPREQVEAWSDDFVARWMRSRVRPGALKAIERHRAAGDLSQRSEGCRINRCGEMNKKRYPAWIVSAGTRVGQRA